MTTYTDEVNVYNPEAIASGIADAGETATNYLSTVDQTGLMVHPANDSTTGWKISSAIELLKSGVSYIKLWLEGNPAVAKLRLGLESAQRFLINSDSLQAYDSNNSKYFEVSSSGLTFGSNTAATNADLTAEINQRKAQYGTCSTGAGTQAKAVTCANFELVAGNELTVKFSTANTYASGAVQLNVNSKGAKNVWVANAVTSSSNKLLWGAGAYITFRYDGTQFIVIGEPREWYGASTTAAGTAAKTDTTAVTGCVICKGTKVSLAMTNENTAASPTLNIQSTGALAIYAGNSTTRPLASNGLSWSSGYTQMFVFDGTQWRTGDSGSSARAKAQSDAAAKTATNYITATASDGIKVHNASNTTTYVQILNDAIDFVRDTASMMKLWLDNSVAKIRVGLETAGHAIFSSDGMELYTDSSTKAGAFTTSGVSIGKSSESRFVSKNNITSIYSKNTEKVFEVVTATSETNITYVDVINVPSGETVTEISIAGWNDTPSIAYVKVNGTSVQYSSQAMTSMAYLPDGTIERTSRAIANLNTAVNGPATIECEYTIGEYPATTTIGSEKAAHTVIDRSGIEVFSSQKTSAAKIANDGIRTGGTLDVAGNTTLGGTLGVTGNATVGGTLDVTGNTALSGTLTVGGTSVNSTNILTSDTLGIARGGTGNSSFTAYQPIVGGTTTTGALQSMSSTNTGAMYRTSTTALPVWGTLPAAQGGTGQTSLQATRNAMGLGNTTGALPVANGGTAKTSGAFHSCTQLYNSTTGSNGTITLSAAVTNYDYLAVWTVDNNSKNPRISWIATRKANTASTVMMFEASSNTGTLFRRVLYTISGTSMTPSYGNYIQNTAPSTWSSGTAGTNYVKVTRVMGYVI